MVNKYPSSTCECERISAAYSIFLSLTPTYHQLCSSVFVSDAFLLRYKDTDSSIPLGKYNLRLAMPSYYASGRMICSLIKDTTSQAIDTFLRTTYVSSYLTPEEEFYSRIDAFIKNFQVLAPTTFTHLSHLVQGTTQGNQLLSGTFTNAKFQYNISSITEENKIDLLWINPNDPSCSCGLSSNSCALSYNEYCNYTFVESNGDTCRVYIPGLIISCYLVDGLLLSTGECFYDYDCVASA